MSRKPGNVREFDSVQGNVRDFTKNQGNVGKNLVREKLQARSQKCDMGGGQMMKVEGQKVDRSAEGAEDQGAEGVECGEGVSPP